MEASDATEAEMYALLVGCRELLKLGGLLAIIEGDSFSRSIGAQETLHIFGNWQIGWRRCRIFLLNLMHLFTIFSERLMKQLMVSLRRECLLILFILLFNDA